ncbi:MAG: hypothetical protein IJR55_05170 [Clostridia bacterium]|nr:hypothetical protein [Clostridia bacterium]
MKQTANKMKGSKRYTIAFLAVLMATLMSLFAIPVYADNANNNVITTDIPGLTVTYDSIFEISNQTGTGFDVTIYGHPDNTRTGYLNFVNSTDETIKIWFQYSIGGDRWSVELDKNSMGRSGYIKRLEVPANDSIRMKVSSIWGKNNDVTVSIKRLGLTGDPDVYALDQLQDLKIFKGDTIYSNNPFTVCYGVEVECIDSKYFKNERYEWTAPDDFIVLSSANASKRGVHLGYSVDKTANIYTSISRWELGEIWENSKSGGMAPIVTPGTVLYESSTDPNGRYSYIFQDKSLPDIENVPTHAFCLLPYYYQLVGASYEAPLSTYVLNRITPTAITPKLDGAPEKVTKDEAINGMSVTDNPGGGAVVYFYSTDNGTTWTAFNPATGIPESGSVKIKAKVAAAIGENGTAYDFGETAEKSVTVKEPHIHNFTYSANGATITASCSADGCELTDKKVTLTINKPTLSTYGEAGKSAAATLTVLSDFNAATGKKIAETDIKYVGRDGTTYTESATAPTGAGKYTAKITVEEKTARVDYEIAKATPTCAAPTGLTATYGQTLGNVALAGKNPSGNTAGNWQWVDDSNTDVGNAGTNTFKATFTPTDTANYNTVSDINVSVTVGKANPTYTVPTGLAATYGDTLSDVTLPNGWAWQDDAATSVGNVGTNTFKATFTPTDTANYNTISNIDVSVTVGKVNPTYTVPTGLTATYGDTLSSVTLPTGWSWADGTQTVGNVGTNTFKATFTPTDTAIYNTVSGIDVSVTVSKANPAHTVPSGLAATYGDTLSSVTLPTGWSWTDGSQIVGNAGTNTFKAVFTPTDTNNYNTVTDVDVSVTVNKATPTYTVPTGLTATYGDKLSSVTLPTGWAWADADASVGNAGTNAIKAIFTPADTANYKTVENIDVTVKVNRANITPSVSIESWTYGQEANKPSVTGNAGKGDVAYSYAKKGSDDFSNTVPTKAGEYTVKAVISATTNYNGGEATADFKIAKADPKYTIPTKLTASYGDSLKSVKLPEGWEWNIPSASVGNAGTNRYKATFTPEDTENYNTIKDVYLSITVSKVNPVYTVPTGLTATYGDTLANIALPSGWTWVNATETVDKIGTNTFKAKYTPTDSVDYNTVNDVSITVTVGKKTVNVTADSKTKTYGDVDPALTYRVEGLVGNDTLSGALSREAGENVGTYSINQGTLSAGDNYVISFTGADLSIGAKTLVVTANDQKKPVGTDDPELTYTVNGLVDGDTLTGALAREAGEIVGTYSITQGTLASDGNYVISFTGATFTISVNKVETGVEIKEGAPETDVENMGESEANALLTEEEKKALRDGEEVKVYIEIIAVDNKDVPAADKAEVEKKAENSGTKVGMYLDLSLLKKVGESDVVAIHDTNGNMVKVTITVPEELRSTDPNVTRTFYVVRVHDGEATVLGQSTGDTVSFETDKFSTYALTYKDEKTSSLAWLWIVLSVACVAAICITVYFVIKKKNNDGTPTNKADKS